MSAKLRIALRAVLSGAVLWAAGLGHAGSHSATSNLTTVDTRAAAISVAGRVLDAVGRTPLAAVTFVLEEIVQDLNSRILGSVLLASLLGAWVVHAVIGKQPSFTLGAVEPSEWAVYLLVPVVAAVAAGVGIMFQKATLALRDQRQHRALTGCRCGCGPRWARW